MVSFHYTCDAILPAVTEGVEKSGRSLPDVAVVFSPFLAVAAAEDGVETTMAALKERTTGTCNPV